MLDPEGRVRTWNRGAERIKGYTRDEIVGRHFSCFYEPEDLARDWPRRELELAAEQGRFEDERWRVRKTARDSGRTSSSPPCAMRPELWSASRKSPAI